MPIILFASILVLFITGWGAYFISGKALTAFRKRDIKYAAWLSGFIFLFCFALFSFAIFALILANITLGR